MKTTVTYTDFDTGNRITRKCLSFNYGHGETVFSFLLVDEPPTIFKTICIMHPVIYISQEEDLFRVVVIGYQELKGRSVQTETVIETCD